MAKNIVLTALLFLFSASVFSQDNQKKFWLSGSARGIFYQDELSSELDDSLTAPKSEYGHTLVDLSANIRPNKHTFIRATLRVRNEYGGFWGGGITFDMRELYLKGLIANSVRYQMGDIQYKLTPFTFYNNNEDMYENSLDIFKLYSDILHYDLFYNNNNTWRQQGVATDFALTFKEGIEELQFNLFSSRINPTDFGSTSDRVFFGGNVTLIQSELFSAGFNYVNLTDILGTSSNTTQYKNPVMTGSYKVTKELDDFKLQLTGESGVSECTTVNDEYAPLTEDFFHYAKFKADYEPFNLSFSVDYRNVGPDYRSVAAQTRRLRYTTQSYMYTRYTNDQIVRPIGIWDFYNDASIYNTQFQTALDEYYPQYNNVDPYGLATPNRKGFDFSLSRIDDEDRYKVNIDYGMLSDIIGQGVEELRKYNSLSAQMELNLQNFTKAFDREVHVQLGYIKNHTTRTSAGFDRAEVDLKSQRLNAGITIQLTGELDLLAGYENYATVGSDHIPERNEYNEVIDLNNFEVDLKEQILGLGLRYEFDDKNDLQILWQKYSWSNTVLQAPDYDFNRVAVAYKMKF